MSTSFDERISALIDGELTEFEARRVAAELTQDPELQGRYERYVVAGDVIRNELPDSFDMDFSSRVMAAIDEEEARDSQNIENLRVANASGPGPAAWKKPLAGAAIAASVAMLALTSLQTLTGGGQAVPELSVATATSGTPPATNAGRALSARVAALPVAGMPSVERNEAMPQVTTVSATSGEASGLTMLPNARVGSELMPDEMAGYLSTHAEFASRSGVMSRIRMIGYEPAVETVPGRALEK